VKNWFVQKKENLDYYEEIVMEKIDEQA